MSGSPADVVLPTCDPTSGYCDADFGRYPLTYATNLDLLLSKLRWVVSTVYYNSCTRLEQLFRQTFTLVIRDSFQCKFFIFLFSGLILIVLLATAFLKSKLYNCYPCTSIFLPLDLSSKVDWSSLYCEGKISVDYGAVVKKLAQKRGVFTTFKSGVADYFRNNDFTGSVDDSVLATYIKLDGTDVQQKIQDFRKMDLTDE